MPIVFTAVFSFLTSIAGRFLSDVALRYIAYKTLVFTLLTVTLPIILKNFMTWLFKTVTDVASSSIDSSGIESTVIHLSGVAGYLASHLMLADCLSVILTAIAIRLTLNFIPFIG